MNIEHLEILADAGWEIASHTIEHTTIGTFDFVENAAPEDTRIYPEQIRHGYHRGKTLELTNGNRTIHRTVVDYGEDDSGRYIKFEQPCDESFAADETVVRYSPNQMHESLAESKCDLEPLYAYNPVGLRNPSKILAVIRGFGPMIYRG